MQSLTPEGARLWQSFKNMRAEHQHPVTLLSIEDCSDTHLIVTYRDDILTADKCYVGLLHAGSTGAAMCMAAIACKTADLEATIIDQIVKLRGVAESQETKDARTALVAASGALQQAQAQDQANAR